MGDEHGNFFNFGEKHEVKYLLNRRGYRETEENIEIIQTNKVKIKTWADKEKSQKLTHNEIDKVLKDHGKELGLEAKL